MSDVPFAEEESEPATDRPDLISSSSAPGTNRVSEVWAESATGSGADPEPVEHHDPVPRVELSAVEARVVGAMIEKSFLTPDVYPMTTNGLATACNQKTNRDPVVDYSPVQIDRTLLELRQRNLVRRVHTPGSRSTKHRQTLDEALALNSRQLALVSVLLLRGPQTIGELRLRTERHDVGFDDLDAVEQCLEGMAGRTLPLVKQLPRQPGHKENRWQHLLADPDEVDDTITSGEVAAVSPAAPQPAAARVDDAAPAPIPSAETTTSTLAGRVGELEAEVATLKRQLASLAEQLGETLD